MSAELNDSTAVDPSAAPAPAEEIPSAPVADDSPAEAGNPGAEEGAGTGGDAKPNSSTKPARSSGSSNKKVARPRPSAAGGSKKGVADDKSFKPGETVLARLRGYPPWPARITKPEDLPRNVLSQRPGKSPHIYCVQFFPAGDYAWLNNKEIQALPSDAIKAWLAEPHRKASGGLRVAYETAQDPTEWDSLQDKARKELEEEEENVDQLEDEEGEGEGETGGKRKRAAPEKGKSKKAKLEKKTKVEEPKSKPTAKPKAEKAKQAKAPESKPAPTEPGADDDPLASDPECVKVKDWRHKLQRAFLGKGLPTTDEMDTYDNLFKTIENYPNMTIEALQYSKIGKVMKKIATLEGIPRNEQLRITDRASKLMHEWQEFISRNEVQANGNGDAAAQANGDSTKPVSKAKEAGEKGKEGQAKKVEGVETQADGDKMDVEPA